MPDDTPIGGDDADPGAVPDAGSDPINDPAPIDGGGDPGTPSDPGAPVTPPDDGGDPGAPPADTPIEPAPQDFSVEFSGDAFRLAPYRNNLTRDEAFHLLRRTSFGAREARVEQVTAAGLYATVDALLADEPIPDWIHDLAETYDDDDDLAERWLVYMIESPKPLHERMALFWHDRFATSRTVITDGRERNLPLQHLEMLRANALGNYRSFLLQLTLDPLMLLWLNGNDSPKDNPNENYTREFWELFTLGRDTLYTEADIVEGARAFTGITLLYPKDDDPRPIFDLYNHDNTTKTVFPERGSGPANHDYISITDLTLAQPEAAEYVARNLFVYFVHDEPTPEMVRELADVFVANNFEIRPLVRTILLSQAMFAPQTRYSQVTSPVEHFVSFARTMDMHIYSDKSQTDRIHRVADNLRDAGQDLLNPPGVEGWTEGVAWLKDQWIMSRVDALRRTMDFGPAFQEELPYHLLPSVDRWDQREIREEIVLALAHALHLDLTDDEIDIYIEVLDQNGHVAFHLIEARHQPQHVFEVMRLMAMDQRFITR